jgi:hypothetical protein
MTNKSKASIPNPFEQFTQKLSFHFIQALEQGMEQEKQSESCNPSSSLRVFFTKYKKFSL